MTDGRRHRRSHSREGGAVDPGSGGNTSCEEDDEDMSDGISCAESGHLNGVNSGGHQDSASMRRRQHQHERNGGAGGGGGGGGGGNHQKIALAYNV